MSGHSNYEGMRALVAQLDAERDLFRDASAASELRIIELTAERDALRRKYAGLEQLFEGARETTRQDRVELEHEKQQRAEFTVKAVNLNAENERLRAGLAELRTELQTTKPTWFVTNQLRELREAAEALVEHIERKYIHLVAPSDKALREHKVLGDLARAVLAKGKP